VVDSPPVGLLDGKVAVVTGAGRGLGRSHALALAAAGAAVVVNDVDLAGATVATIQSAGGRAAADDSDVSTLAGAAGVVRRAVDEFGRVDVVVNNAGVSRPCPIAELDDAALDLHLGVHLRGTAGTMRAAFPVMAAQGGGRIVNTVSGHAFDPKVPGSAAYAAAKGAIFSFTLAAAREGAAHGILVNAIAPLAFTPMSEAYLAAVPDAAERLDPAHVSRVVVWLASDAAAGVTGRVIRVEGNMVMIMTVERSGAVPFERMEELLGG
jgi:NAD(P)-dependent dehydrogenase (short-subunit alcohol dehydrogenase family)